MTTRHETLTAFVESYARQAGFTSGRVEHAADLNLTFVYLDDDVVDEHALVTVLDRDLTRYGVSDVLRLVAYQIDRARRRCVESRGRP